MAKKKEILILGAGFAGLTVLNGLLRSLKKRDDIHITLIDEHNFFLFSPLLHEAAVGVLLPENIVTPIRKLRRSRIHKFVQARVEAINLKDRKVTTSAGVFDYDYIVLALGSVTDNAAIANIKDNDIIHTLKTVQDATLIKSQIIRMFEKASVQTNPEKTKELLTFMILGGGYTGIQFTASLYDAAQKCLAGSYRHIDPGNFRIILLESQGRIIRDLPEKHSQYIMKYLQSRQIDVRLNTTITRIDSNGIEINDKEIIASQTLVCVPGVVANPVISTVEVDIDDKGRVAVNDYMEVIDFPDTYAIGDCARFKDPITGQIARPRAHVAVRQARAVVKIIVADLNGKEKKKYILSDSEEIISLGRSNALLRIRKLWIHGLLAVLVWVMSYSLLAFGKKNRMKIAIDWILSWIYGPDFVIIKSRKKES